MAIGVYRGADLVDIAETYVAAQRVASRFKENRRWNKDTYTIRKLDVFTYRPEVIVPEFIHQALTYPNEHMYYVFSSLTYDTEGWIRREYMSPTLAAKANTAFPPYYYVRADNEEDAVYRFTNQIMKTAQRNKGRDTNENDSVGS